MSMKPPFIRKEYFEDPKELTGPLNDAFRDICREIPTVKQVIIGPHVFTTANSFPVRLSVPGNVALKGLTIIRIEAGNADELITFTQPLWKQNPDMSLEIRYVFGLSYSSTYTLTLMGYY